MRKESRLQQKYYDRVHKKNTTFIVPAAVIAELIGSFFAQRSNAVWRVELSRESWCWRVVKFPFGTAPWCCCEIGKHARTSFAICGDLKWHPCVCVVVLFLSAVSQTFRVCEFGIISGCLSSVWLCLPLSIRRLGMCCVAPAERC